MYPNAQLVCHDHSEAMLTHARQKLAQFSPSVSFVNSDLKDPKWIHVILGSFDAVVSSIAIHNILGWIEEWLNLDVSLLRLNGNQEIQPGFQPLT
jgi:ubiquinone/menaquinone biosynthesis C-methylase UbiE